MAFSSDPFEKDKIQQQQNAEQPAPTQLASGGGAFIDQQSAIPQSPQGQPAQQKQAGSGRFQNLQKYIQANQPGAQQIGQKVQQNVAKQSEKVTQNIGQANTQLMSGAEKELGRLEQGKEAITKALEAPSEYASDEEKFKQFQQYRKGISQAQDIQNLSQLQNQASAIGEMSKASQSEQGRLGLLKNTFANKNYGQGASRLDQLLLQSNPNNLRQLAQSTKASHAQQMSNIQNLQKQQEQYNKQIAEQAAARQKEATTGLETNIGAKESELSKKAIQAQIEQDLLAKYAQQAFGEDKGLFQDIDLTAEEKAKSGLEKLSAADILKATGLQAGQNYFRLTPQDILRAQQVERESVASAEDVKRLDDLRKLQEMENTFIRNRDLIGKYTAGQLQGTEELQTGIKGEQDLYNTALAAKNKQLLDLANARASLEQRTTDYLNKRFAGAEENRNWYVQGERTRDWARYNDVGQGITWDMYQNMLRNEAAALAAAQQLPKDFNLSNYVRTAGDVGGAFTTFNPDKYSAVTGRARAGQQTTAADLLGPSRYVSEEET
jgi:hypothetical protein